MRPRAERVSGRARGAPAAGALRGPRRQVRGHRVQDAVEARAAPRAAPYVVTESSGGLSTARVGAVAVPRGPVHAGRARRERGARRGTGPRRRRGAPRVRFARTGLRPAAPCPRVRFGRALRAALHLRGRGGGRRRGMRSVGAKGARLARCCEGRARADEGGAGRPGAPEDPTRRGPGRRGAGRYFSRPRAGTGNRSSEIEGRDRHQRRRAAPRAPRAATLSLAAVPRDGAAAIAVAPRV